RAAARPNVAGDPDDGAGHAAVGDAGGERGRLLLHTEALPERRTAGDPEPRRGAPQASRGERRSEAGDPAPGAGWYIASRGAQPRVAGGIEPGTDGGADGVHRPYPGRVRYGEGGCGAVLPRPLRLFGQSLLV